MIVFSVPGRYNKDMRVMTLRESMLVRRSFWITMLDVTLMGVVSLLSIGIGTILSTILLNGVE